MKSIKRFLVGMFYILGCLITAPIFIFAIILVSVLFPILYSIKVLLDFLGEVRKYVKYK